MRNLQCNKLFWVMHFIHLIHIVPWNRNPNWITIWLVKLIYNQRTMLSMTRPHYAQYPWWFNDVIMSTMASQITSITIVYSTVYTGADQRKHQSSASLAFVWGIHRGTGEFPAQIASNAENVSIWWRHHEKRPHTTYHESPICIIDDVTEANTHNIVHHTINTLRCCKSIFHIATPM